MIQFIPNHFQTTEKQFLYDFYNKQFYLDI